MTTNKESKDERPPSELNRMLRAVGLGEGQEDILSVTRTMDSGGKIGQRISIQRQYQDPLRMESPRRAHVFHSADGLGQYLEKAGGEDTVVLGDVTAGIIHAVLNDRASLGFETVRFCPVIHPLWRPWEDLLGEPRIELDAFVDFLLRNRRVVTKPDGMELVHTLSQIKASTSIELHRGRGNDALNGILTRTKIQGQVNEVAVDLPTSIRIEAPIYIETQPRTIDLDITLQTVHGEPGKVVVFITSGDMIQAKVDAFMAMFAVVKSHENNHKWTVSLGRAGQEPWDYAAGGPGTTC